MRKSTNRYQRITTFYCQGLLNIAKQKTIADDFITSRLIAMVVQETHMQKSSMLKVTSSCGKQLDFYYAGN